MKQLYQLDHIINPNEGAKIQTQPRVISKNVTEIEIDIRFSSLCVPQPIVFCFQTPCVDLFSIWGTGLRMRQYLGADWGKIGSSSCLSSGAPLHALLAQNGENRMCFALSDAKTPCKLCSGVNEETALLFTELQLFKAPIAPIDHYHAILRIDTTHEPFDQTVKKVEKWWGSECGYPAASIPVSARDPMYSTWYSFHHTFTADKILAQCRMAKELGMEAVIVDAGWEMEDDFRTFAYCGDWEYARNKFPNMREFSDRIHKIGMKVLFWFSVPFVGARSKAYKRFSTMVLGKHEGEGENACYRLDPRYPGVRSYLVDIYRNAMLEWGIDGFKLDFIDSFKLSAETPQSDPRRDIVSLEDAVDCLLAEVTSALRAINPDVLIEFRQTYTGPVIRKYGNLFRVFDCPNDPLLNRFAMGEMRTMMGNAVVHSDMLMWHTEETPEAVARQLLATLFMVPQISVLIETLPKPHYTVLQNYLALWKANREVLLEGEFRAYDPVAHYSLMSAEKDGILIAAAYIDTPLQIAKSYDKICFFNVTGKQCLALRYEGQTAAYTMRVYNCLGEQILEQASILTAGIYDLSVPDGGRVELQKS